MMLIGACAGDEQPLVPAAERDAVVAGAFRGGETRSGTATGLIGDEPRERFRIEGSEPVIASVVVADGVAYVPNDSGSLLALDPLSGDLIWDVEIGDAEASVVVSSDTVFAVGSDGTVTAHDRESGAIVWTSQLGGFTRSSPILTRGRLVVAVDETLVTLDPSTGDRIESLRLETPTISSPAVADEIIVLGTASNQVFFMSGDPLEIASFDFGEISGELTVYAAGVAATPAVADGVVYVGSTGGAFAALGLDASPLWQVELGSPIYGSAAVGGELVYVATAAGQLLALDRATGTQRWVTELGDASYASPVLVGQALLITAESGVLFAFDAVDGELRWEFLVGESGNYMASTPAVVDSVVILGSNDGSIVSLDTDG